MSTTTIWR